MKKTRIKQFTALLLAASLVAAAPLTSFAIYAYDSQSVASQDADGTSSDSSAEPGEAPGEQSPAGAVKGEHSDIDESLLQDAGGLSPSGDADATDIVGHRNDLIRPQAYADDIQIAMLPFGSNTYLPDSEVTFTVNLTNISGEKQEDIAVQAFTDELAVTDPAFYTKEGDLLDDPELDTYAAVKDIVLEPGETKEYLLHYTIPEYEEKDNYYAAIEAVRGENILSAAVFDYNTAGFAVVKAEGEDKLVSEEAYEDKAELYAGMNVTSLEGTVSVMGKSGELAAKSGFDAEKGVFTYTLKEAEKEETVILLYTLEGETEDGTSLTASFARLAAVEPKVTEPEGKTLTVTPITKKNRLFGAGSDPTDVVISIDPSQTTIRPGGTATFNVNVTNKSGKDVKSNKNIALFTLGDSLNVPGAAVQSITTPGGDWVVINNDDLQLKDTKNLQNGKSVTYTVTYSIPANAQGGSYSFEVNANGILDKEKASRLLGRKTAAVTVPVLGDVVIQSGSASGAESEIYAGSDVNLSWILKNKNTSSPATIKEMNITFDNPDVSATDAQLSTGTTVAAGSTANVTATATLPSGVKKGEKITASLSITAEVGGKTFTDTYPVTFTVTKNVLNIDISPSSGDYDAGQTIELVVTAANNTGANVNNPSIANSLTGVPAGATVTYTKITPNNNDVEITGTLPGQTVKYKKGMPNGGEISYKITIVIPENADSSTIRLKTVATVQDKGKDFPMGKAAASLDVHKLVGVRITDGRNITANNRAGNNGIVSFDLKNYETESDRYTYEVSVSGGMNDGGIDTTVQASEISFIQPLPGSTETAAAGYGTMTARQTGTGTVSFPLKGDATAYTVKLTVTDTIQRNTDTYTVTVVTAEDTEFNDATGITLDKLDKLYYKNVAKDEHFPVDDPTHYFDDATTFYAALRRIWVETGKDKNAVMDFYNKWINDLKDSNFGNKDKNLYLDGGKTKPDYGDESISKGAHIYAKDSRTPFHVNPDADILTVNSYLSKDPNGTPVLIGEDPGGFSDLKKSVETGSTARDFKINLEATSALNLVAPTAIIFQIQTSWQMFDIAHANDKAALVNGKAINDDILSLYEIKHGLLEFEKWIEEENAGASGTGGKTGSPVMIGITNFQHGSTYSMIKSPYFTNNMENLEEGLYGWDSFGDCEHIHYKSTALTNADNALKAGTGFGSWVDANDASIFDKVKENAKTVSVIIGGACEAADLNKNYLPALSVSKQYGIRTNARSDDYPSGHISWMDQENDSGKFDTGKYYYKDDSNELTRDWFLNSLKEIYNKSAKDGIDIGNVTIQDTVTEEFNVNVQGITAEVEGKSVSINTSKVYSDNRNSSGIGTVRYGDDGELTITYSAGINPGNIKTNVSFNFGSVENSSKVQLHIPVTAKDDFIGGNNIDTNTGTPSVTWDPYEDSLGVKHSAGTAEFTEKPAVNVPVNFNIKDGGETTVPTGTEVSLKDNTDLNSSSIVGDPNMIEDWIRRYPQVAGNVTYQWVDEDGNPVSTPSTVEIPDRPGEIYDDENASRAGNVNALEGTHTYSLKVTFDPLPAEDTSVGTPVTSVTKSGRVTITANNPSLMVLKHSDGTLFGPNETITYTILVKNNGDSILNNVNVTDTYDDASGLTLVGFSGSVSKSPASCDANVTFAADRLSAVIDELAPNESMEFTYTARTASTVAEGKTYRNIATASSGNVTDSDDAHVRVVPNKNQYFEDINKTVSYKAAEDSDMWNDDDRKYQIKFDMLNPLITESYEKTPAYMGLAVDWPSSGSSGTAQFTRSYLVSQMCEPKVWSFLDGSVENSVYLKLFSSNNDRSTEVSTVNPNGTPNTDASDDLGRYIANLPTSGNGNSDYNANFTDVINRINRSAKAYQDKVLVFISSSHSMGSADSAAVEAFKAAGGTVIILYCNSPASNNSGTRSFLAGCASDPSLYFCPPAGSSQQDVEKYIAAAFEQITAWLNRAKVNDVVLEDTVTDEFDIIDGTVRVTASDGTSISPHDYTVSIDHDTNKVSVTFKHLEASGWDDDDRIRYTVTFDVKAKTDFVGGNNIHTNELAGVSYGNYAGDPRAQEVTDDPAVNVPVRYDVDDYEEWLIKGEKTHLSSDESSMFDVWKANYDKYDQKGGHFEYQWVDENGNVITTTGGNDWSNTLASINELVPPSDTSCKLKVAFIPDEVLDTTTGTGVSANTGRDNPQIGTDKIHVVEPVISPISQTIVYGDKVGTSAADLLNITLPEKSDYLTEGEPGYDVSSPLWDAMAGRLNSYLTNLSIEYYTDETNDIQGSASSRIPSGALNNYKPNDIYDENDAPMDIRVSIKLNGLELAASDGSDNPHVYVIPGTLKLAKQLQNNAYLDKDDEFEFTVKDSASNEIEKLVFTAEEAAAGTIKSTTVGLRQGMYTITESDNTNYIKVTEDPITAQTNVEITSQGKDQNGSRNNSIGEWTDHVAESNAATATILNRIKASDLIIRKLNTTGDALNGVKFEVYKAETGADGKLVPADDVYAEDTTHAEQSGGITVNGTAVFPLVPGTYLMYETKTVKGYNRIAEPWTVVVGNDGQISVTSGETGQNVRVNKLGTNRFEIEILNSKLYSLPSAGGIGNYIFYIIGSFLITLTGILAGRRFRRQQL